MNAYKGANSIKRFAKKAGVFLVPGEEIRVLTSEMDMHKSLGEVIVYFPQKEIKPSAFESILDEVKSQGALLSCPHPFDWPRADFKEFPKEWKKFGAMEIYNARAYYQGLNDESEKFAMSPAVKGKIACLGVSDAHTPEEIGNGLTEISAVNEEEFRKEIKKCRTNVIANAHAGIKHHFQTQLAKRKLIKER